MGHRQFIVWQVTFSVGNRLIDEEHKTLFRIINSFYEKMTAKMPRQDLIETLRELSDYGRIHFSDEENLMKRIDFPGLAGHMKAHRSYLNKIDQFRKELSATDFDISLDVFTYIKKWLTHHVLTMDQEYAALLRK